MDGWLLVYAAMGGFFGFLAGLLGIGGGAVSVPVMIMAYAAQDFDRASILHLALGTGMATIVFTSIASLRAHHRHGAVDWRIVRRMTPGIVIGTLLATSLVKYIPTFPLAVIFVAFLFYMGFTMIANWKPKPSRQLPGSAGMSLASFLVGAGSGIVAIGGGALTIPFMAFCNVPFHTAIGTSAALGFPIALTGAIGYIINGWGQPGLPAGSLGYVYLPALVSFAIASMALAPMGARLAHRTSTVMLKRIFATVLLVLAVKMLTTLW
jgi:uncharacterized protein